MTSGETPSPYARAPGYGEHDVGRIVPLTDPRSDPRSLVSGSPRRDFERDRARVLHSSALRRLAGKTQVVGVGVDDFPRNRLTHSLECAQIGRSLAEAVGCDPDLVEAACLAHDLGHPPFGHTGEDVLDKVAESCGGFEGNAQTFRILTRIEAKTLTAQGDSVGLNLTRAVLDATIKYPWTREHAPQREGARKFAAYSDDISAYEWVRRPAPGEPPKGSRRSLEAQVMDWADDIAYSVHDVEDGIHSGHISLDALKADVDERAAICREAAARYSSEPVERLVAELDGLLAEPAVADVGGYDGTLASQVALKRLASVLISEFMAAAVAETPAATIAPGATFRDRTGIDLVVPAAARGRCALMKAIAARYVIDRAESVSLRAWEQDLLAELVDLLWDRAPVSLPPAGREAWARASDDAARLRSVVDVVASMTDTNAVRTHARLRTERGRPRV